MVAVINAHLKALGLPQTAFPVEDLVVVPVQCDTWTFRPDHSMRMIKESLGRYI